MEAVMSDGLITSYAASEGKVSVFRNNERGNKMKDYITTSAYQMAVTLLFVIFTSCFSTTQKNSSNNATIQSNPDGQVKSLNGKFTELDKNIRSVFQDSRGNYWIGTNSAGVYRYDSNAVTQFTVKDGLADNQVVQIQEDDFGNMWFGTGAFGISKFDGSKFTTLTHNPKMTRGDISDWISPEKALWFCAGGGLFRYSNTSLDYLPLELSSSNAKMNTPFSLSRYGVYSILRDRKGNLWFGTQAEGVCRYDGKMLSWFKEKGLSGPAVLGLFEDSKGNLWFGNNGGGLFRYDGKTLINFTQEMVPERTRMEDARNIPVVSLSRIYAINEDNIGNIWVGTVDSGVWKYDGKDLTNYTTKDGLTGNAINTIFKDKSGELWFGTDSNGICKFNGTTFTEFRIEK
jgi:ligand-binding sensor domain-containing protein